MDRQMKISTLAVFLFVACAAATVNVHAERIPEPSETMMVPPLGSVPEPAPPPIGDGSTPNPVTAGDAGEPSQPPSGTADPTHGNIFTPRHAKDTRPAAIYGNGGRYATERGTMNAVRNRMGPARNYAPDTMPAKVRNDPTYYPSVAASGDGASWTRPPSGGMRQSVRVEPDDGSTYGTTPDGASTTPLENNPGWAREMTHMPMPTVRKFARLLVLLGVVFATVLIGFAAMSMCLGHPFAGGRVISTAAGLLILLAGCTIYKVIMINAFRFGSSDRPPDAQRLLPPRPTGYIAESPSPRQPRAEEDNDNHH